MSKLTFNWKICSACLSAGIVAAITSPTLPARADGVSVGSSVGSPGTLGGSNVTTPSSAEDLGGTPDGVESMSVGQTRTTSTPSLTRTQQSNARRAVESGDIRSYGWLLKKIRKAAPGDIVKVGLKHHAEHGWTYDVTILRDDGRYVQLSLNAATGAVISRKER